MMPRFWSHLNEFHQGFELNEQRVVFLRRVDLFHAMPSELLADVAGQLDVVRYPAGDAVFLEGQAGDAVFIVREGRLSLQSEGTELLSRGAGECVGEFALIDDEPRSATAIASTDVTLFRWDKRHFHDTLEKNAATARGIFRTLTAKLREDLDARQEMNRLQQDLSRAHEIQMGMLPGGYWSVDGLEIAGWCAPAAQVGGDYYDYLQLNPMGGQVGVIIGDVTGHGFYSGLFVAMAKSCFHTQAPIDHSPEAIMNAMRTTVNLSIDRQLLMSCCYLLLCPGASTLRFANAGHPPPLLLRARTGELEELPALDTLLGVLDADLQPTFASETRSWKPGDLICLYSDGVTEARGPGHAMFGEKRLRRALVDCAGWGAQETLNCLLEAISDFGQGVAVGDDLTLVVVKAE